MIAALLLATFWGLWVAVGTRVHRPPLAPRLRSPHLRPPVRAGPGRRRPRPRLGWVLASVLAFVVWPPLAVVPPVAVRMAPIVRRHREVRSGDAAVRRELPDVVDLLVLAIGAGLTVPLAVAAVARHGDGPVAAGLGRAVARTGRGARLADALTEVPDDLGERVRPLVAVLVASERYGVPVRPALERLAVDSRDDRRRHAEAAARRLPVKLLFPLVLCTLPAFALLTVVPLLMGSLRELRL